VHIVDRASFCPCPFCPLRYATIYILFVLYIVFDFVLDVLEGGGGVWGGKKTGAKRKMVYVLH
jgi:hypothetical protein